MFDRVEIIIKAGGGGDGAVSFRREKFVPWGGPDGGDGGNGGDVTVRAAGGVTSLNLFQPKRLYQAEKGENGKGKKKSGRQGQDLILNVPVGTVVLERSETGQELLIADCEQPEQSVVVARGGKGGWGNTRFASATNQAPRLAQKGEAGEKRSLILEMRLIADAGIIGYPNVGKSTLLSMASAAKPKIASYPFTTLQPVLGVVEIGQQSFVLAEIPGLVAGAHLGRGLGHDFLRHAVRTRLLIHLIDGASPSPVEDMRRVNTELSLFDAALAQKPQLVAVNKIDLPEVRRRLSEIKEAFTNCGVPIFFIAAASGEGVTELMAETMKRLKRLVTEVRVGDKMTRVVFRPMPKSPGRRVYREGDTFIVVAPQLERIVTRVDMSDPLVRGQFRRQLTRLGVSQALARAGVNPGDKVRCGNFEWEW